MMGGKTKLIPKGEEIIIEHIKSMQVSEIQVWFLFVCSRHRKDHVYVHDHVKRSRDKDEFSRIFFTKDFLDKI